MITEDDIRAIRAVVKDEMDKIRMKVSEVSGRGSHTVISSLGDIVLQPGNGCRAIYKNTEIGSGTGGGGGAVTSVFGRTGAVIAQDADYVNFLLLDGSRPMVGDLTINQDTPGIYLTTSGTAKADFSSVIGDNTYLSSRLGHLYVSTHAAKDIIFRTGVTPTERFKITDTLITASTPFADITIDEDSPALFLTTSGAAKAQLSVAIGDTTYLQSMLGHLYVSTATASKDIIFRTGASLVTRLTINDSLITSTVNITTPSIKITGGTPGSGKVLTSDADGDATWETAGGGVTDHGGLTGLADDDHTQYVLATGARTMSGDLSIDEATPGIFFLTSSTAKADLSVATGTDNTYLSSRLGHLYLSTHTAVKDILFRTGATPTTRLTIADSLITAAVALQIPTIKITGGTPGSGKVLTSDADGDATWGVPANTTIFIEPERLRLDAYDGTGWTYNTIVGGGLYNYVEAPSAAADHCLDMQFMAVSDSANTYIYYYLIGEDNNTMVYNLQVYSSIASGYLGSTTQYHTMSTTGNTLVVSGYTSKWAAGDIVNISLTRRSDHASDTTGITKCIGVKIVST